MAAGAFNKYFRSIFLSCQLCATHAESGHADEHIARLQQPGSQPVNGLLQKDVQLVAPSLWSLTLRRDDWQDPRQQAAMTFARQPELFRPPARNVGIKSNIMSQRRQFPRQIQDMKAASGDNCYTHGLNVDHINHSPLNHACRRSLLLQNQGKRLSQKLIFSQTTPQQG